MSRKPLPPFTPETAAQKAHMGEDAWNTRDPARVALHAALTALLAYPLIKTHVVIFNSRRWRELILLHHTFFTHNGALASG
jgi:nuclear transport factor 2 (NTF2) superfamily protein